MHDAHILHDNHQVIVTATRQSAVTVDGQQAFARGGTIMIITPSSSARSVAPFLILTKRKGGVQC